MAGIGFILGGALKGLGDGLAAQTKMNDEARRDAALRAARMEEIKVSGQLSSERDAQSDLRERDTRMMLQDDSQGFTAEQNTAAARAAASSQAAKFEFEKYKNESDQAFELRKLRLQSALTSNADVQKIIAQAEVDKKEVKDVLTDGETGAVSVIFADGSSKIAGNVIARPKPTASDSDAPLDVSSYSPKGAGAGAKSPQSTAAKTATRDQLAEMAKQANMTPAEAEQWAKAQGWTIR